MITIGKPAKKYSHPYGDFIYGDDSLIGMFDKKLFDKNILPLNFTYTVDSTCSAIGLTGVVKFMKQFEYECPFNGYLHKAVIPVFIASDEDVARYFAHHINKPWYADMTTDQSWVKQRDEHKCEAGEWLTNLKAAMIGPGYTDMCYPSDGSASFDYCTVPLSNGDTLVCVTRVWHNK